MSDLIKTRKRDGILELILNRPNRKNAITSEMYLTMTDEFTAAEADPTIGVILILGSESCFTAGNDLADFQKNGDTSLDNPPFTFMRSVVRSTKTIVAGVSGPAIGIGTTLLLHCDLVVAGSGTTFAVPFVDLGLVPEFASSRLLPALMGRQRAARHILLCDPFDAQTAFDVGLVSEVVEDARVDEVARSYARRLMAKAPGTLAKTRSMIIPGITEIEDLIATEAAIFARSLTHPEFAEALTAFLEKRPPQFERPIP